MNGKSVAAVEADSIARAFGARRAVDGVSLRVHAGETLALFGPNGAGKTTLLRLLGGLIRPTGGNASIGGQKVPGGPEMSGRSASSRIGHFYMMRSRHERTSSSSPGFTGWPRQERRRSGRSEQMGIADRADAPVRSLSRG
jgi:ABC-type multidrug transport system ATPase subunit